MRTATEAWLDSQPSGPTWSGPVPTFDLGLEVSDPKLLKELIYTRNLNDFRDFGLFEVIDPTADG